MKRKLSALLAGAVAACVLSQAALAAPGDIIKVLKGDMNMDKTISIVDVVELRSHIVGGKKHSQNAELIGDMNGDKTADVVDVVIMRLVIVGNTPYDTEDESNYIEVTEEEEVFSLETGLTDAMKEASLVSEGNLSRLARVIKKAQAGEEITFACLGGSITQGSSATDNYGYAYLLRDWFEATFPQAKINYVNAGIGATDSHLGIYRLERDVLSQDPDLVIVEFSVNDTSPKINAATYEAVVRTILSHETDPAVMLLFMTQEDGTSLVDTHRPIGEYYDLPMISYKNAIMPVIERGDIVWDDISPDNIHPNDAGHKLVAGLVENFLNGVIAKADTVSGEYEIPAEPKSADCEKYSNAIIANRENGEINIISSGDFADYKGNEKFKDCWQWKPESPEQTGALEFEVTAKTVSLIYREMTSRGGKVEVYINGERKRVVDADFKNGWGSYPENVNIFSSDTPQKVNIKLVPVYNSDDTAKNTFIVYGFGVSK